MKPYVFRNNDTQHQERIALVAYHSQKKGRTVYYCDILHDLQHEAFLALPKSFRDKYVQVD